MKTYLSGLVKDLSIYTATKRASLFCAAVLSMTCSAFAQQETFLSIQADMWTSKFKRATLPQGCEDPLQTPVALKVFGSLTEHFEISLDKISTGQGNFLVGSICDPQLQSCQSSTSTSTFKLGTMPEKVVNFNIPAAGYVLNPGDSVDHSGSRHFLAPDSIMTITGSELDAIYNSRNRQLRLKFTPSTNTSTYATGGGIFSYSTHRHAEANLAFKLECN